MKRFVVLGAAFAGLCLSASAHAGEEYPTPIARPIFSSPSGNDHGTNSNYPLDPSHTVIVMQGGLAPPSGGGDSIVQSLNSLPGALVPTTALAGMPRSNGG